ncbi:MAG: ATP-dependent helicase [bacterium]
MLITGELGAGKTSYLVEQYCNIVMSGISPSEIMVICQNKHKQNDFTSRVLTQLSKLGYNQSANFNIRTFNGIVYNFIFDNWSYIEQKIVKLNDKSEIFPNLCGLESTEYLLRNIINVINQRKDVSDSFRDYLSSHNLLHQILRRYSLIIQNNLSDYEINNANSILNETHTQQVEEAIKSIKKQELVLRHFDYLRQTEIFSSVFQERFDYFKDIKYLFVDDFDEIPYVAQNFIREIRLKSEKFYISADLNGGSRRGYLCAYPEGLDEIKNIENIRTVKLTKPNKMQDDAEKLFVAIKSNISAKLDNFYHDNLLWRTDMIKNAMIKITDLVADGVDFNEIVVVAPDFDICMKYSLQEFFEQNSYNYQFFSGSKKLIDDKIVKSVLIIAQIINKEWYLFPSKSELSELFSFLWNYAVNKADIYQNKRLNSKSLKSLVFGIEELDVKYAEFLSKIEEISEENLDIYSQLGVIFTKIILPIIDENTQLNDFNNLLKSLREFQELIIKLGKELKNEEREWIIQIKSTVVSDNPAVAEEINENAIKIATPQKVVDLELHSNYQIWIDTSSNSWIKDDTGPLYNSWMLRKNCAISDYTPDIHRKLTLEKSAHLLRKLVLCSKEHIYCYSSDYDSTGRENAYGGIVLFLGQIIETAVKDFNFTPREDQKDIIDYKGGMLAVPAVPGAGKTTVMQGLIHKLIKDGTPPEKILVLTYMDSAAENIREKIKSFCGSELPHVSTIHSLALKILKENDNYSRLGLEYDFNICDGDLRPQIINERCGIFLPTGEDLKKWTEMIDKGIIYAKQNGLSVEKIEKSPLAKKNQIISEFLPIYRDYQQFLKSRNMIDFDDVLYLCSNLLKENKEVRAYYQDKFTYVIEDEAQDSSEIQQRILSCICEKHKNLIRCGDVNQAITTTFSNADVEGFKSFINENNKVEMDCSQRCAEGIYTLANELIKFSREDSMFSDAFYEIYMKPVKNSNPVNKDNLCFKTFETSEEEKDYITSKIKKIIKENPNNSVAVLLRNNFQVLSWASLLESNEIPFICKTDSLKQKKVFRFLLSYLKFLAAPHNKDRVVELFNVLTSYKLYKKDFVSLNFLNNLGSPFLAFKTYELPTEELIRFKLDLEYWLYFASLPVEELVIKLGHYYFIDTLDRANMHLFALFVKKFREKETDYQRNITVGLFEIVKYFEELGRKDIRIKYFEEEEENIQGQTCLMTVHKAKGLGFDVVFMPSMHEDGYSYSVSPDKTISSSKHKLTKELDKIMELKTDYADNRIMQCNEHLRLIYVGITRAKRQLYMTSYYKNDGAAWLDEKQPSKILNYFAEYSVLDGWKIND